MVYIVLNFVARGVLSLIETLGTPLFHQYNHLQQIVTRRKQYSHGPPRIEHPESSLMPARRMRRTSTCCWDWPDCRSTWAWATWPSGSGRWHSSSPGSRSWVLGCSPSPPSSEINSPDPRYALWAQHRHGVVCMTRANARPWPQLVCGSVLVLSLGSPIVQTLVVSSFSTILGTKPQGSNSFSTSSPQSGAKLLSALGPGTLMGILTMSGSLGRIFFPMLYTLLDERGSLPALC